MRPTTARSGGLPARLNAASFWRACGQSIALRVVLFLGAAGLAGIHSAQAQAPAPDANLEACLRGLKAYGNAFESRPPLVSDAVRNLHNWVALKSGGFRPYSDTLPGRKEDAALCVGLGATEAEIAMLRSADELPAAELMRAVPECLAGVYALGPDLQTMLGERASAVGAELGEVATKSLAMVGRLYDLPLDAVPSITINRAREEASSLLAQAGGVGSPTLPMEEWLVSCDRVGVPLRVQFNALKNQATPTPLP